MAKWLKGYKLVRRENNRMFSFSGEFRRGDCVEYIVGQATKPMKGCGPLFVLTDNKKDGGPLCLPCLYLPSKREKAWFFERGYKWEKSLSESKLLYPDAALATQVKLLSDKVV
jgi:hypothetical protein